jgi:hypothetical protein
VLWLRDSAVTDSHAIRIWDGENRRAPAARNPLAFRVCRGLQFASYYCVYGVLLMLALLFTNWFLRANIHAYSGISLGNHSLSAIMGDWMGYIALALFGLFPVLVLLRFTIVMFAFARFTLMQMFLFVAGVNMLASLVVVAPPGWNLIPAGVLAYVVFKALLFLGRQDPDGENDTPGFIRERLRTQRLAERERKKSEGSE